MRQAPASLASGDLPAGHVSLKKSGDRRLGGFSDFCGAPQRALSAPSMSDSPPSFSPSSTPSPPEDILGWLHQQNELLQLRQEIAFLRSRCASHHVGSVRSP